MPKPQGLRKRVSAALVAQGFKRHGRMHLMRVDDDFSFWVDTGTLGFNQDIAPFLGVRCDLLENTLQDLLGTPRDPLNGSFGGNVGYVLDGKYRSWHAPISEPEVLEAIERGLARYRPFLSIDRLLDAEAVAGIKDPGRAYRIVVVHLLQGNLPAARIALEEAEREYCEQDDEICQQFREFVLRAKSRFNGL